METESSDLTMRSLDVLKWNTVSDSTISDFGWGQSQHALQSSEDSPDPVKHHLFDSPRATAIGAEHLQIERHEDFRGVSNSGDTLSLSALLDPLTSNEVGFGTPTDGIVTFTDKCQHSSESLFTPSLSRSLTNSLDNQAGNFYTRLSQNEKHLSAGASVTLSSLWDQQSALWTKTSAQRLPGSDSFTSSLTQTASFFGTGLSDSGKMNHIPGQTYSALDVLDADGSFTQSVPLATSNSTVNDERRLHCPDGADQPDEHLWLYEDPQGRTQGSFSDAQMNDWLSAGIYFTPVLRIRRKCDSNFATLAEYTRLFGRTPFTPGPRVPPIRNGIAASLLNAPTVSTTGSHQNPSRFQSTSLNSSTTRAELPTQNNSMASTNMDFTVLRSNTNPSSLENTQGPGEKSASGINNSFSSVSTPPAHLSALSNALSALSVVNQSTTNQTSLTTDPSGQGVTSASTLMALASLISVNPTLASLAMSFSGQGQTNNPVDFSTSAALAPGFLAALAQYLNVQPHLSGQQSVSPMQQLAETAQLAAQLAAMASAHSPIEPAQALALAELVKSQAQSTHVDSQWFAHCKKESVNGPTSGDSGPRENNIDPITGKSLSEAHTTRTNGDTRGVNATSAASFTDNTQTDAQSHWPLPSGVSAANSRTPNERRRISTKAFHTAPHGDAVVVPLDHFRDDTSAPLNASSNRRHLNSQSSIHTHGSRNGTNKTSSQHEFGSLRTGAPANPANNAYLVNRNNDAHVNATNGNAHLDHDVTLPSSNQQRACDTHWVNKVKQHSTKSSSQSDRVGLDNNNGQASLAKNGKNPRRNVGQSKGATDQNKANPKSVPTQRSPNKPSPPRQVAIVYETTSTTNNSASVTSPQPILTESGRTAEEELQRLTEWCQARLSQMPMREKVDIPTVVELLATLDAPYEVETMVQTFLGESSRTSLFVKEFLDQRRPFWQLHRERRESEAIAKCDSKTPTAQSSGNGSRSTDKKKRSGNNNGDSTEAQTTLNNGSSWTKVRSTQTSSADQSQDNQWHHIRPRGSHNRKGKKEKAS